MDCTRAKSYVDAYIKRMLPERKQEAFIKHIKTCPECFQELETYFIVDVAMKYFDGNQADNYDIRNLLQNDLDRRLRRYQHKKFFLVICIALLIAAAFLAVGV